MHNLGGFGDLFLGTSSTNSSCTCNSILALKPPFFNVDGIFNIAIFMMSAAVP
ncbi:MAG: hypothetical protein U0X74_16430 [Anaerolineales bacterium]